MGQLVELPIDQAGTYVIQDASGAQIQLGSVQGGKSLLKPELAQHLSQHAGGYKPLSTGTPVGQTGGLSGVHSNVLSPSASGLLSLGTRYTPSSATVFGTTGSPMSGVNQGMSGAGGTIINPAVSTGVGAMSGMGVDRDSSYRLAAAIAGTSGRGRPRGRRPLRGQFPVVPIDMVRQLGIEQQVILQPAAPVAMRNKAVLCRPLSMCRKTQANASTAYDSLSQHGVAVQTDKPSGVTELSNDKTSIGKEIQTQTTEHLMKSDESDDDEDMVPVAEVEDDQLLIKSDQPKYSCVETSTTEDMISMDAEVQTDLVDQDESKKMPAFLPIPIPVPIYVPFPVCLYARPVPYAIPYPLPCPIPIPLVFDAVSSDASLTEGNVVDCWSICIYYFQASFNNMQTHIHQTWWLPMVSVRDAHCLHSYLIFIIDVLMELTLTDFRDSGIDLLLGYNLADSEYADYIVFLGEDAE
ncbi:unnamed protein product [Trichobilharzia regenti]|nr:unnamed protein product [Trichobilharzia regenti]